MIERLLKFYDWVSVGRDVLSDLWLLAGVIRTLPIASILAGYSLDSLAGGLIGGSIALLASSTVFAAMAVVGIRRMPLQVSASLLRASREQEATGAVVRRDADGDHEGVAGWVSARLHGSVIADESNGNQQVSNVHCEMSKLLFGFLPVQVARLDYEPSDGDTTANDFGWILPLDGEASSMDVYFAADRFDFSRTWKIAPGDRVRTRIVAQFGSSNDSVYVQVPRETTVKALLPHQ